MKKKRGERWKTKTEWREWTTANVFDCLAQRAGERFSVEQLGTELNKRLGKKQYSKKQLDKKWKP